MDRRVTVAYSSHSISISEDEVLVDRGDAVTFDIQPGVVGVGIVKIRNNVNNSPPTKSEWLNGGNILPDSVTINVPPDAPSGLYKYDIEITGVGCLDPYIRVN